MVGASMVSKLSPLRAKSQPLRAKLSWVLQAVSLEAAEQEGIGPVHSTIHSKRKGPPQADKQEKEKKFFAKNFFPGPVSWPVAVRGKGVLPGQGWSAGTSKPATPCTQRLSDPLVSRRGFGNQNPFLWGFSTEMQEKAF
eukprot:2982690-Amphidinium_carterae.1